MDPTFEWDEQKNRENQRKHGVAFEGHSWRSWILGVSSYVMLNTVGLKIATFFSAGRTKAF